MTDRYELWVTERGRLWVWDSVEWEPVLCLGNGDAACEAVDALNGVTNGPPLADRELTYTEALP